MAVTFVFKPTKESSSNSVGGYKIYFHPNQLINVARLDSEQTILATNEGNLSFSTIYLMKIGVIQSKTPPTDCRRCLLFPYFLFLIILFSFFPDL